MLLETFSIFVKTRILKITHTDIWKKLFPVVITGQNVLFPMRHFCNI